MVSPQPSPTKLGAHPPGLPVSQFTLQANLRKGSKPDFHGAMPGEKSSEMYDAFLADLRKKYKADKIFDGKVGPLDFGARLLALLIPRLPQFGAMMDVQLINDVRPLSLAPLALGAPCFRSLTLLRRRLGPSNTHPRLWNRRTSTSSTKEGAPHFRAEAAAEVGSGGQGEGAGGAQCWEGCTEWRGSRGEEGGIEWIDDVPRCVAASSLSSSTESTAT